MDNTTGCWMYAGKENKKERETSLQHAIWIGKNVWCDVVLVYIRVWRGAALCSYVYRC
jgi:hypothetical protein